MNRIMDIKKLPKTCGNGDVPVCDFCLHFLFYRDKFGLNLDGSGWCGLHKRETDAGSYCKDYYCKTKWEKNMKFIYSKRRDK